MERGAAGLRGRARRRRGRGGRGRRPRHNCRPRTGENPGPPAGAARVDHAGGHAARRPTAGRPADHRPVRARLRHRVLPARPAQDGVQPAAAVRQGHHGHGTDDRHRRLVRIPDDQAGPGRVRQAVRLPRAALVHDPRAGREDPGVQPQRPRHGRLGERDHAGRGVRARPRAGGEHPAGRDPGRRDGGNRRLPADRRHREVRDRSPSRRRDQPELQRHRGDVRQPRAAQPAARRLSRRVRPPRHGARRLRRQRRHRLRARPAHVLHPPGDVVAGQRPAGDGGRRHPADPGRRQVHVGGLERHRRHRGGQVL